MVATGNVGFAFGLVLGAGLCTTLGASFALFAKLTDTRLLAGSLGVSAGVMTYVSIVEIFTNKAVGAFNSYGFAPNVSMRYATFCFFGGILVTWFIDLIVHLIVHLTTRRAARKQYEAARTAGGAPDAPDSTVEQLEKGLPPRDDSVASENAADCDCCPDVEVPVEVPKEETDAVRAVLENDTHTGLSRMGVMSATAVAIHNLPEGMATFVGALANPSSGIAIAVAIALHNIPEGVVVAMPIYYATGSRLKGFVWAFLSGITEPIGGLLAYVILYKSMSGLAYAIMFGIVSGMMVYISIKDLLPTALKYDPKDNVTTPGFFVGMAVMAASLLMFAI